MNAVDPFKNPQVERRIREFLAVLNSSSPNMPINQIIVMQAILPATTQTGLSASRQMT